MLSNNYKSLHPYWSKLENTDKICGIDLDGVLVDYPKCWLDFINLKTGRNFKNLLEAKASLSYNEYRFLKHYYRASGYKRNLPAKPNATEFIQKLKEKEYKIFILTARPFDKYENLFADTIHWLQQYKIDFDGILFGKDKHIQILYHFPKLNFMVEDHRGIANLVANWNYKVFLLSNEYNIGEIHQNVIRVNNLLEILEYI